jgi:hypothetical protein
LAAVLSAGPVPAPTIFGSHAAWLGVMRPVAAGNTESAADDLTVM